jgi:hypothetical protein
MTEYLVTDMWTGKTTWVVADSKREACILHENAKRTENDPHRLGMPQIPLNAKATCDTMLVQVGDSAVSGRDEWVVRSWMDSSSS